MISIFFDLVEQCLKIFMDDFSVHGDAFEVCLFKLGKVLTRYRDKDLTLSWGKCHFIVKREIVLGHIISSEGIEVDKAKVDLNANLPLLTCVKDIRYFLGHASFYWRFIKDFSRVTKPLSSLLAKDTPFYFSKEYELAFTKLKSTS